VAVVNPGFAKRCLGGQNPVGRRFMLGAFVPGWKASRIDPVSALKYE
jgi:hypothetical protein